MRKFRTIILFATLNLLCFTINAQAPQGIQYQGIARDITGATYNNQAISTTFIIHDGGATGTTVFNETQSLTTNGFGLFTAVIGSVNTSAFPTINWATGSKYLEVQINGTSIGTTQLQSVPYALYAASSGSSATGGAIQSGSGAPTITGSTGDFYIDITTSTLYGPYTSGSWGSGTSLIGAQGTPGAQGPQGVQGIPGTAGTNGTNGTPGTPGTNGTNGTNGNTILTASGAPNAATGVLGDFYIDSAAHIMYGPKTATGWPASGISLVGPAGTFGVTGINGQTIYNNAGTWQATSNLFNDGTNVGIGSTSPLEKLQVEQTGAAAQVSIVSPLSSQLLFGKPINHNMSSIRYDHSSNRLVFQTNGTDAVYIDALGSIAVGTPFTVSGGINLGSNNGLSFDGTTYDANHTNIDVVNPTAVRNILFPDNSGTILLDPTTANGDLIYRNAGAIAALPHGAVGDVLNINASGIPQWGPPAGGVASVTVNNPLVNSGSAVAPVITLPVGNVSETTSSVLSFTGATGAVIGSGLGIQVKQAGSTTNGYLSSIDWNTFNGKGTVSSITATAGQLTGGTITTTGTLGLATTGVTPGTYGNAGGTQYATITVDAFGRVTSAGSQIMTGMLAGGTVNYVPRWQTASMLSSTSQIWDDGTNVGFGITSAFLAKYHFKQIATGAANGGLFEITTSTNTGVALAANTSGTGTAFSAANTGTSGGAGSFQISGAGNGQTALNVSTSGSGGAISATAVSGPALNASNTGGGHTISATNNGTGGSAGYFNINNASNGNAAVFATTTGGGNGGVFQIAGNGTAIAANNTGTGNAGMFTINNAANTQPAVQITTNGSGKGLYVINNGGGYGGYFYNSSPNTNNAIFAQTDGTGAGIYSVQNGTAGAGGLFQVLNASNSSAAIVAQNNGAGGGGSFSVTTAGNSSPAISATTSGSGYSGVFSGGLGVKTDKLSVTAGAGAGYMLISNTAAGDATWVLNPASINFAVAPSSTAQTFVLSSNNVIVNLATPTYVNGASIASNQFVAPSAGVYHFDVQLVVTNQVGLGGGTVTAALYDPVATSVYRQMVVNAPNSGGAGTFLQTFTISADLLLTANQKVALTLSNTSTATGYTINNSPSMSWFNGHKVY